MLRFLYIKHLLYFMIVFHSQFHKGIEGLSQINKKKHIWKSKEWRELNQIYSEKNRRKILTNRLTAIQDIIKLTTKS